MGHRMRGIQSLLTGTALLLSACGGTATPAAVKLTMASSTTAASQLPFWMAVDGGLFKQNGLDVSPAHRHRWLEHHGDAAVGRGAGGSRRRR